MTELRKPETQAKIGAGIATVHQHLNDPEKRAELERAAGTAGKTAARMLGRAAGTLQTKSAATNAYRSISRGQARF